MALFDIHHPWAFTFGVLGNIVFDPLPYAVALFSAILWLYYAFLKTDETLLISINSFGCIVEGAYILVYLFYASKTARAHAAKLLGLINLALLSLIILISFFLFQGLTRVRVVGWICVSVSVVVFAAPLNVVLRVVRTKSVEFMPFALSFFLTLSAVVWFGYGVSKKDLCVALPNVFGFFLGVLQMLLYGIFRKMKCADVINNVVQTVGDEDGGPVLRDSRMIRCEGDDRPEIFCVPCAIVVEGELTQVKKNLELESSPVLVVCAV